MANSIISRGLPGMPGAAPAPQPLVPYQQQPMSYQVPAQIPGAIPAANNPVGMLNQIRQFASQVRGNPQQMVMSMIQNGSRTNADLQQAMQIARQITGTGMFK